MQNIYFYETEVGRIAIAMEEKFLTNIFYEDRLNSLESDQFVECETKEIKNVFHQIQEYLRGERKVFNIQILLKGTNFQKSVWERLIKIPYGVTCSYKEIAKQIGIPKGARAVGMANHNNPIPIIVPCHRVIGTSGNLVGYGGGLDLKQKLLTLEVKHKILPRGLRPLGSIKESWTP
jgi:methylated-DNA-[protein]-cysteine S-methyltransferase